MTWPYLPYTLPLLLAIVFAAVPAYAIWLRRTMPGARPLLYLVGAAALWSAAHALQLLADSESAQYFWYAFSYLPRFIVPIPMLLFVLVFTGNRDWITRRRLFALCIAPALLLLLVWTNTWHHFIFASAAPDTTSAIPALDVVTNTGYFLCVLYGYGMLGTATLLLLDMLRRAGPNQRPQVVAILLALLAPGLVAALVVSGLHTYSPADPTPLAVSFGAAALCLFHLNFRSLDILPLARDAVMEEMHDSIIVLDPARRVVDCNAEAARLLGTTRDAALGRPVAEVLHSHPGWSFAFCLDGAHTSELTAGQG